MDKDEKIEVGRVYNLELNGDDFGKCLYLGERRGSSIKYKHVLVRRSESEEFIFGLVFGAYSLRGDKLILGAHAHRRQSLSSVEEEFLDGRLNIAGITRKNEKKTK